MNTDLSKLDGSDSLNNSPTKPLKFPKHTHILDKECNSSSDTYTSEVESPLGNLIDKNFDLSDSLVHKTIAHPQDEEFSFATPMTSTIDLNLRTYNNSSPNKSILRKTPTSSPKKNVGFTTSNQVHHYVNPNTENSPSDLQPPINDALNHEWNELHQKPISDEESTPPAPPPHSSNTYQKLLNSNQTAKDDLDLMSLTNFKLKHSNFSNLSLNEKLDLYLSNNNDNAFHEARSNQELDQHLVKLNDAAKYKTDSNIHYLSLSLQNPSNEMENPLDSLTKDADVQLRSSGSSQSSLVSLRDSNRTLQSLRNSVSNKGTELNDGIKGFSDSIAGSIIPYTDTLNSDLSIPKKFNNASSEDERFPDSFDKSYTTTEKSIMNLLNSTSTTNLTAQIANEINAKSSMSPVKLEPVEPSIKQEGEQVYIKLEPIEVSIKDEKVPEIPTDDDHVYELHQLEAVSDYGISSLALKFIKSEVQTVRSPPLSSEPTNSTVAAPIDKISDVKNEINPDDADESSRASIRFHMDSDWRLEDSHDGDREDNDGDYSNNDVTIASQRLSEKKYDFEKLKSESMLTLNLSPSSSLEFDVASKTLPTKSLAPGKVDEAVKPTKEYQEIETSKTENDDSNVLANSSNIAPPEEITLPIVEINNYSSFEELTRNITEGNLSYEESLSAEHDAEGKPANFISIWRLQEKHKKHTNQKLNEYLRVLDTDDKPLKETKMEKFKIPAKILNTKFKEVNVMSRRVVSPGHEDLNISGFLPELSEDSGFENHFKFLKIGNSTINYSNVAGNRRSFTALSTKNVLTNMDNNPNILEPPLPSSLPTLRPGVRTSNIPHHQFNFKVAPQERKITPPPSTLPKNNSKSVKSKFKVPSFEIRRSSSILSPRNKYNDIFDDTLQRPATIKGTGMKTLPSMDRNDVKRILSAKRTITQEEYSKVKLVGTTSKKNSVVNIPQNRYDDLQQHASICDTSMDLTSSPQQPDLLPHVTSELMRAPEALLSKDQHFKSYDMFGSKELFLFEGSSRAGSVVHTKDANYVLPDPDPEFVNTPVQENIFKTPPRYDIDVNDGSESIDDETKMKYQFLNNYSPSKNYGVVNNSPSKNYGVVAPKPEKCSKEEISPRKAPIKIGSPVNLVKNGSTVTGVSVPSSPRKHKKQTSSFTGGELLHNKLRDNQGSTVENHEHVPSTVSVPSNFTKETLSSEVELMNEEQYQQEPEATKEPEVTTEPLISQEDSTPTERGRLFLRVVGLKNLQLPNLNDHKSEFSITLDNGVHCIKTPNYRMDSSNILVGKEFELTVGDSLEFILTLKAAYEKPKGGYREVTEQRVVKSKNRLSRMFGSREIVTTTKVVPTEANDAWKDKFAQDGSFARCYVDLDQYESGVTGTARCFDLTCFNEWETYMNGGVEKKRKPYKIGQLEVKMMFIPRRQEQEVLPTSIKAAYESVGELQQEVRFTHEGYMYQEGGDCEVWKKRFFKLHGTSLIAHSEYTHKTRAKINLSKIVDVIYVDKENLNNSSINYRNFSDVLLMEHSFKVKFANGELIDFGAPNKEEKLLWISIFEKIIYRNRFRRQPWVKLMLEQNIEG